MLLKWNEKHPIQVMDHGTCIKHGATGATATRLCKVQSCNPFQSKGVTARSSQNTNDWEHPRGLGICTAVDIAMACEARCNIWQLHGLHCLYKMHSRPACASHVTKMILKLSFAHGNVVVMMVEVPGISRLRDSDDRGGCSSTHSNKDTSHEHVIYTLGHP